jgi:hypothetical protein
MRKRFQPREVEEVASAFDRVYQAKDIAEDFCVVRILFEANEFDIDNVNAFVGLRQEFPQQFVHGESRLSRQRKGALSRHLSGAKSVCC